MGVAHSHDMLSEASTDPSAKKVSSYIFGAIVIWCHYLVVICSFFLL